MPFYFSHARVVMLLVVLSLSALAHAGHRHPVAFLVAAA